jgi:pyridinium-3,5-biscarboxylic acid mononucleotide sulfurtransferase
MSSTPSPVDRRTSEPEVVAHIRRGGPALVALSGGVDSSLVAALAHDALGDAAIAATIASPAVAAAEVDRARRVAEWIGLAHRVVVADPLARTEYRANAPTRCYFCRSVETEALRRVGTELGRVQYLDGVQLDDLADDRPGLRAMDEAGFDHPLIWAGWRKADVRAAARARGLPNWDQPSDACLSSRVTHGRAIDAALLERIEAGEAWLLARGFRRVRVRTSGTDARVEVDPSEVARLTAEPMASETRRFLERLGFEPVALDPVGYRGASLAREVA